MHLITVETRFHSMSNGQHFSITQIALVVLIPILSSSAICGSIDPLVEQIYWVFRSGLLNCIQRIRNISTREAKDLRSVLEPLMSALTVMRKDQCHAHLPLHKLAWIERKGQLMDHLAYEPSFFWCKESEQQDHVWLQSSLVRHWWAGKNTAWAMMELVYIF